MKRRGTPVGAYAVFAAALASSGCGDDSHSQGGDKRSARARTATPDERAELRPIMTKEWPDYDRYQEKTDREIPVVVLEPR